MAHYGPFTKDLPIQNDNFPQFCSITKGYFMGKLIVIQILMYTGQTSPILGQIQLYPHDSPCVLTKSFKKSKPPK